MGDERRINQLTAKAYDNIGSRDYFAVDNASEAESKKLPASSIKTPISNLQGEVTGGSDTYSSTKNYSVGMYATHTTGGVQKLYRCKTACTAASWTTNASCFEEANLADAVSALNNDLTALFGGAVQLATQVLSTTEQTLTISGIENYEFLLFEVRTQGLLRGSTFCIQRKPYEYLCLWNYSGTIYNTKTTFDSSINKTVSTGTAGNAGALYIYGVKKKHN